MDLNDTEQAVEPSAAPEQASEPSLRDVIAEAARSQRETPAPAAEPEAPQDEPEGEKPAERTDGRDAQGRFAPKPEQQQDAKPAADQQEQQPEPDKPAEAHRPPPGWSPQSKADFGKLPPHIQADIAKREQEVNQGFAELAEYKDLKPLAQLARQNGTTLAAAVNNYRNFEVQLQQDFVGGIAQICQRFGIDPGKLGTVLSQRGEQAPQQQAPQPQFDPNAMATQIEQRLQAKMEQERTQQAIAAFAADPKNLYFENVKPVMAQLVTSGLASSLQEAYDKACLLVPEVAALVSQRAAPVPDARQAAAHQARAAAKATTGAPAAGFRPGAVAPDANASLRDTIVAARNAQLGRA